MTNQPTTIWRTTAPYQASSTLVPGIVQETLLFLQTYADLSGASDQRIAETRRSLIEQKLPQRSRASRKTMVERIQKRLTSWNPPQWVLDDLAAWANADNLDALKAALLLHVCRQDSLLYAVVQELIAPRWFQGERTVTTSDIQHWLDVATRDHSEIESWTYTTRNKLASTTLSTLRDYGLLQGQAHKQIVKPLVPQPVVHHLVHLLQAEGMTPAEIPFHPDWQLWLWTPAQTAQTLRSQMASV